MKRIFTIATAALMAAGALQAQELNIYASGLSAGAVDNSELKVNVSYTLNAPATSLALVLQEGENTPVEAAITGAANWTKGAHVNVAVDLSSVPTGNYKWSIKATGGASVSAPTLLTDNSLKYLFWGPRGVVVDNSFDSPYFGNFYVSEGAHGKVSENLSDTDPTRTTKRGIYAFNPLLEELTPDNSPYTGGRTWTDPNSLFRLAVAPDGKIYICDFSTASTKGVYIMDVANPATLTTVFTTGERIPHCYVSGTGAATQLFALNYYGTTGGNILRYDIGDLSGLPWSNTNAPSAVVYNDTKKYEQGGNCSIAPDGHGGWWISQYRANTVTSVSCLIHMTSDGTVQNLADNAVFQIDGSYSGGMAVSLDGSLLAIGGTKGVIAVFDVSYEPDGAAILNLKHSINVVTGAYAHGLAFDVVNNLYSVDNNKERLRIFSLPKASNSFTTPAPSSAAQLAVVNATNDPTGVGSAAAVKIEKSVSYTTLTGAAVPATAKGLLLKKTTYTDGSVKVEKVMK